MLLFFSESPGSAVPDSTNSHGTHQLDRGIPWHPGLHLAIGAANAPHRAPAKPPGLAVQAKRSYLDGGFCESGALQGPGNSSH